MPGRKINEKMSKKLVGLFLAVILALVALAVRITYINATSGEQYERIVLSQNQQQYESRMIPFKRGDIVDRNGTILATSERVYNVILDCHVVNTQVQDESGEESQPYVEPTVKALTEILGIDEEEIRGRLTSEDTMDSRYQVLKRDLSLEERRAFEDYLEEAEAEDSELSPEEKEERQNVKGVWFEEDYNRVYPLGSQACDLIGFTYDGTTADWGIEGYYSSLLNGVDGRQYGYYNDDADVEQQIVEPVDGKNVVSTIDINIQQIIRTAIENYNTRMADGPNEGEPAKNVGVIVMDPDTGEILGMDSSDWYDLNDPRDLSSFYTREEIDAMSEEEMLEHLNDIWRNYCISDTYEPGSTYKPITVASALECGAISEDDTYYCGGYYTVSGQIIRCAHLAGHGMLTVPESLSYSCNACLMQIGEKLGASDFLRYQKMFQFGSKTGIDLPGEASGILFTEDTMKDLELATSTFGQGFTCTMIQEAAAFCSLINGGYYYQPHVVSTVTDSAGTVVETMEPTLQCQTVARETSDFIREALGGSMEAGHSGAAAKVEGYSMGGKTGTAQKFPREEEKYVVSFIGYAPLDDPEVVVYVVIDEPNAVPQSNSTYAQEVAKEILTALLPYMNLYPDEGENAEGGDSTSEQGAYNENLPEPGEEPEDEQVESGGNNLLTDGITNEEQKLLEG